MGWVAVENFNSYTAATDLAGANGGTGWGGAWVDAGGGTWTTENALSGGEGGIMARTIAAIANTRYTRALTTATPMGIVQWRMRTTKIPNAFMGFTLRSGGSNRCLVRFGASGNIEIYDDWSGSYITVAGYDVDEWHICVIEFDAATGYRARAANSEYTRWCMPTGGFTTIDAVMLDQSATNGPISFFVDDIRAADDRAYASGWTASDGFDG
jgi:hypothetical protein